MLLHRAITDGVLGSFYTVYDAHGYGLGEPVYQKSLVVELQLRGLTVMREVQTEIVYKGVPVGLYRADLIVNEKVLVELKATAALSPADGRQVLNYLKATRARGRTTSELWSHSSIQKADLLVETMRRSVVSVWPSEWSA